jgi:capsule polysaccharide export protein KpsE/RkpR
LTDLPAKLERGAFRTDQFDELVIEAVDEQSLREARKRNVARIRLLWSSRRFLIRATAWGLVAATAIAFLIPKKYEAAARLMPPDQGSGTGAALLAAMSSRVGENLTSVAQGMLGTKTTGDLFVGILRSNAVEDDLISKFGLQKLYHDRYIEDARKDLVNHTDIAADPKSGIISVIVTDRDPKRAAAMSQAYVDKLNWIVTDLSTSAAHKERVFLDQRSQQVKGDLEWSEKQFSDFASQKGAIDIPAQGRAMVESAAALQGQLIAAESELQGIRQIYTDNNARVRSLQARVNELRGQLEKVGGTNATDQSAAHELYPSLRELPALGVTYADLLRRTKVEEAVFEALTQEDELAKVEEAKEIPSVKLLDQPEVPQKESFPPRGPIIILGTMLAFVFGPTWVLANSAWREVHPNDPRKSLTREVWQDVRGSLPWVSGNGLSRGQDRESTDMLRERLSGGGQNKTNQG